MTLLERNAAFADDFAAQLAKRIGIEAAKVSTHADTLKWIARAEGDVYLNISKLNVAELPADAIARNPAFPRTVDMFSGEFAEARAYCDAEFDAGEPHSSHLTTIVLHPDGTWSERCLFRL